MILLRFTFANHRSFRDEQDLTLVQPRLRTNRPQDGTWGEYTNRVAAIYGANASGKSGVLDALRYMQAVIENSATSWADRKVLPRVPFALCRDARQRPSSFALDFVIGAVRYEYGFSVETRKIAEEWLYAYPTGRRRTLFERGPGEDALNFGRDLKGGESLRRIVESRELVLSKAAVLRHAQLRPIFDALTQDIAIARFEESDRQSRLRLVMEDVAEGKLSLDDLQLMLKVADVGISGAELTEKETPPRVRKMLRAIFHGMGGAPEDSESQLGSELAGSQGERDAEEEEEDVVAFSKLSDEEIEKVIAEAARSLKFRHIGEDGKLFPLETRDQSTGTLTWLSLAAPALRMVRQGGVFVVDELDASLHPQLAQVMVQMFRDEHLNQKGAQLIFTAHDTYFMSPTSDVRLRPEEIWITEKHRDGASELYSVSEFPTRSDENLSRRYLHGRYGGVPSVAPSFLAALAEDIGAGRVDDGVAVPSIPQ